MIRFTCPGCGEEVYFLWHDISRLGRCTCVKCGKVTVFCAMSEEELIRKSFQRKEKNHEGTEKG